MAPQTEHVGALVSLALEGVGALVSLASEGQAITPTKGYDGTSARTVRRRAMEARGVPLDKERVCEHMRRCKRSRRDTDAPLANPAVQPQGVAERASCPWVLQQALGTKLADDGRDARACKAIVAGAVCSHQRDQIASQCGHHGDWLVWPSVCRVEQTWLVFMCACVCLLGKKRIDADALLPAWLKEARCISAACLVWCANVFRTKVMCWSWARLPRRLAGRSP